MFLGAVSVPLPLPNAIDPLGFPARVPVMPSSTAMDLNLDTAITAMSALMNNWSGAIGETTSKPLAN